MAWPALAPLLVQLVEAARVLHRKGALLCGLSPEIMRVLAEEDGPRLMISTAAIWQAQDLLATLGDATTLLTVGSGADRPAARELALKIEEAAWLPSTMRDLETFLHGHLPATDASTALVLILADRDGRPERIARARDSLAAARVLGLRAAAILARDVDAALPAELTPAGRLVVDEPEDLPAPVAALIGTATPLQLLTERIARARGTNPDLIRRDDPLYLAAADAGG
jgi:fructoselysine-6-P-deglycase FrlB-like protein